MATEKTPNYSATQEAVIRQVASENGGTLTFELCEQIAARDDMRDNDGNARKARSIVAKVTRMGDVGYKAKEPTAKDGSAIVKKDGLVGEIATLVGLNMDKLDSLDKATKPQLVALRDAVAALKAA